MTAKSKIGIVGAGIQGVSNALFLQKKDLTLLYLIEMTLVVQPHLTVMQDIFHHMHLYL